MGWKTRFHPDIDLNDATVLVQPNELLKTAGGHCPAKIDAKPTASTTNGASIQKINSFWQSNGKVDGIFTVQAAAPTL